MLPVSGEQHEKALNAVGGTYGLSPQEIERILATYFDSLAAQGVHLRWSRAMTVPVDPRAKANALRRKEPHG
jgi:hypothetical protein